jgi:hypothetical protein
MQSMNIEEKPAFDTPFEGIGGEARVQALVDRFYDLMDLEPGYAELRAVHGSVARSTTPTVLATRASKRGTCRSKLAWSSATSGWRVWIRP